MVETKLPLHPIGIVSISVHKDGEDSELSYEFHPDAWGHGYATEATRRALDFALNDLAFERLIAETQTANSASCRLLERLGMKE
ncbi:GNAT family N-acetyltransferase, partial [Rhizobium sp.]|uniref:GNAT family N-acetyltransferase n=1 Tax=Rhizobium sp. TaxID=391 RepID=UPI0034DB5E4F